MTKMRTNHLLYLLAALAVACLIVYILASGHYSQSERSESEPRQASSHVPEPSTPPQEAMPKPVAPAPLNHAPHSPPPAEASSPGSSAPSKEEQQKHPSPKAIIDGLRHHQIDLDGLNLEAVLEDPGKRDMFSTLYGAFRTDLETIRKREGTVVTAETMKYFEEHKERMTPLSENEMLKAKPRMGYPRCIITSEGYYCFDLEVVGSGEFLQSLNSIKRDRHELRLRFAAELRQL